MFFQAAQCLCPQPSILVTECSHQDNESHAAGLRIWPCLAAAAGLQNAAENFHHKPAGGVARSMQEGSKLPGKEHNCLRSTPLRVDSHRSRQDCQDAFQLCPCPFNSASVQLDGSVQKVDQEADALFGLAGEQLHQDGCQTCKGNQ